MNLLGAVCTCLATWHRVWSNQCIQPILAGLVIMQLYGLAQLILSSENDLLTVIYDVSIILARWVYALYFLYRWGFVWLGISMNVIHQLAHKHIPPNVADKAMCMLALGIIVYILDQTTTLYGLYWLTLVLLVLGGQCCLDYVRVRSRAFQIHTATDLFGLSAEVIEHGNDPVYLGFEGTYLVLLWQDQMCVVTALEALDFIRQHQKHILVCPVVERMWWLSTHQHYQFLFEQTPLCAPTMLEPPQAPCTLHVQAPLQTILSHKK